jgi:hypothetical protein
MPSTKSYLAALSNFKPVTRSKRGVQWDPWNPSGYATGEEENREVMG